MPTNHGAPEEPQSSLLRLITLIELNIAEIGRFAWHDFDAL